MNEKDTAANPTFLPLKSLEEAPFNPRRRFTTERMAELVASVLRFGVLVPLLVRPLKGDKFQIISGARRSRAARENGLDVVPVRVREMTDAEARELALLENLQGEDLHPLEEAAGYKDLMEKSGYNPAGIAAKISKSEEVVYKRLKLLDLIPSIQKLFLADKITLGHAHLLSRLTSKDQSEALDRCFSTVRGEPSLNPIRDLKNYIENNIHLDLHSAPFKKDDPDLLPEAGPCIDCSKRTGAAPQLFSDIKKQDTCTDPECFHKKIEKFIENRRWEEGEKGKDLVALSSDLYEFQGPKTGKKLVYASQYTRVSKKNPCSLSEWGIIVSGPSDIGKVIEFCRASKCWEHSSGYNQISPDEKKRRAAEREKQRTEQAVELRFREVILERIPGEFTRTEYELLALAIIGNTHNDSARAICSRRKLEAPKGEYGGPDFRGTLAKQVRILELEDLKKFLVDLSLGSGMSFTSTGKYIRPLDHIKEVAGFYSVNAKELEKAVKFQLAENARAKKKAPARKKKAAPKTPASGMKTAAADTGHRTKTSRLRKGAKKS